MDLQSWNKYHQNEQPSSPIMPTMSSNTEEKKGPAAASSLDPHMASEAQVEEIMQDLSCPLCRDWFGDPILLACGHNFCSICLSGLWGQREDTYCPECQQLCQDRQGTPNWALGRLVEKVRGLPLGRGQPQCQEHNESLKLFCKQSGKLGCFQCKDSQLTKGQVPEFLKIPDAVQLYTEELMTTRGHMEVALSELQSLRAIQKEAISAHKENQLRLQHHISLEFLKLHQFLHSKEKRLLEELREEGKAQNQEMDRNLIQLQERGNRAKEMLVAIQSRMEQHNSFKFLVDIKSFLQSLEQGTEVLLPCEVLIRELSLGKFKGPIQHMVWTEMRTILCPGLSLVTLDPKTAHPNLVLSEDQTSVHHDDIKRPLQDFPERFDSSVAVLGTEGFTTGKHYWEVEVANKTKWTVGIVRESIPRKGNCPLSPQEGFWLLRLRNGTELKALDVPSRSLELGQALCKVGVYLDHEGGQVSYYDASTMAHLYTFNSTFTEKLFPYFCPCLNEAGKNSEPLRIHHPIL
ncbi:E3 ubiquitin-protein ligase TRIM69 [Ornithorhynchus anatinus]|uniref:E3 ubiquitin-protein ligase TRIM69 n=1 Tax=Ornithorhynchus anatinus TaxID=9258 RepID=UPI0010A7A793|nr:E3 ubiquitin-protein ligase TRIM69 [Ornithorhynchus anatinus]